MERRVHPFLFGSVAAAAVNDEEGNSTSSSMMDCTLTPSKPCRSTPFSTPQRLSTTPSSSSIRNNHTPGSASRAYAETVYIGEKAKMDAKQTKRTSVLSSISSICGMPHFAAMSHEELRMADYQQGNRGTTTSAAATAAPSSNSPFVRPAPTPPPATAAPVRDPAKSSETVVEYLAPESLHSTDALPVAIGVVEYVVAAPSTNSSDDDDDDDDGGGAAEECSICFEPLSAPTSVCGPQHDNTTRKAMRLSGCGHRFHVACLDKAFRDCMRCTCPICRGAVGQRPTGKMPSGTMTIRTDATVPCSTDDGSTTQGSIFIRYDFPAGVQKAYHPAPGQLYRAATFGAVLPDNAEGRQLLQRLKQAFARGLTFLIGASLAPPPHPVREWIPHKNHPFTANGWPDRSYMAACHGALDAVGVPRVTTCTAAGQHHL